MELPSRAQVKSYSLLGIVAPLDLSSARLKFHHGDWILISTKCQWPLAPASLSVLNVKLEPPPCSSCSCSPRSGCACFRDCAVPCSFG